jgi:hypothetical protein
LESQLDDIMSILREIRDRLPIPALTPSPAAQEAQLLRSMERYDLHRDFLLYDGFPLPPAKSAGSATIVNGLPDAKATPGAFNPDVTQENIAQTIGVPGWTATIRPPTSYTNALKTNKMIEYGLTGDPSDYELDHLIPLCCGGHPTDERNLWPQPRTGLFGARTKDLTEVAAQHAILGGRMSLDFARMGFSTDWIGLHAKIFANAGMREMLATIEHPEDEP